jgi:hypothetical protein
VPRCTGRRQRQRRRHRRIRAQRRREHVRCCDGTGPGA